MLDKRKVVIIGAGHVGSHVAMALCFQGTCDEIAFIDIDREKAVANCYDVADACLFLDSTTKIKVGDYEDCRDADIIVNSIGMPRKPGQTRLDMLDDSIRMLKDVVENLKPIDFKGIFCFNYKSCRRYCKLCKSSSRTSEGKMLFNRYLS